MNGQARHLRVPLSALATVSVPAPARTPTNEPRTWATALERCRVEENLKQAELLTLAFPDGTVNLADLKRWETAHGQPSTSQAQKLRAALPRLFAYDHLLPPMLQASAKQKAPTPQAAGPEWPGPPVTDFAQALRWCVRSRGQKFTTMCTQVGVTASALSNWGKAGFPNNKVIRVNYDKLVALYPELKHAPVPEFSVYTRTIKKVGYLRAQEAAFGAARIARDEPAPTPAPPPSGPDRSKLQAAGAALGIYSGELASLKVQAIRLKRTHDEELQALGEKQKAQDEALQVRIADTEKLVEEQRALVEKEAHAMHGGEP